MKKLGILLLISAIGYAALAQSTMKELEKMKGMKSLEDALADPTTVVKLELKGEDLGTVPLDINRLVNLEYLDLTKTNLNEFPVEITKLTKLQYLDLGRNDITKIPDEIARLENLKFFGISRNKLYLISPEMGKLKNLEVLELYDNPIKEFPEELRNMSNLKELDVRVIILDKEEKKKLMKMFPYSKIKFSKSCETCD